MPELRGIIILTESAGISLRADEWAPPVYN